ncbi:MAG: FHA domain-containing protein [Kofleriaceae bacterium]
MTLDERPRAQTFHELLLEVRAGYVLHRPILVDVSPVTSVGAEHTVERTLTMTRPAVGESELVAELGECRFAVVGPNTLHHPSEPPVTIGRSRRCDLRVDNESVSKVHGSIRHDPARGYLVTDQQSRNGTCINDEPVVPGAETVVFTGARLALGDAAFVFIDPPTLRKLARLAT